MAQPGGFVIAVWKWGYVTQANLQVGRSGNPWLPNRWDYRQMSHERPYMSGIILFYVCRCLVCLLSVHHFCVCFLESSGEGIKSPGAGILGGWKLPCGCQESNLALLQEQQVFLVPSHLSRPRSEFQQSEHTCALRAQHMKLDIFSAPGTLLTLPLRPCLCPERNQQRQFNQHQ